MKIVGEFLRMRASTLTTFWRAVIQTQFSRKWNIVRQLIINVEKVNLVCDRITNKAYTEDLHRIFELRVSMAERLNTRGAFSKLRR